MKKNQLIKKEHKINNSDLLFLDMNDERSIVRTEPLTLQCKQGEYCELCCSKTIDWQNSTVPYGIDLITYECTYEILVDLFQHVAQKVITIGYSYGICTPVQLHFFTFFTFFNEHSTILFVVFPSTSRDRFCYTSIGIPIYLRAYSCVYKLCFLWTILSNYNTYAVFKDSL